LIDEAGGECWTWAITEEDAKKVAYTVPGFGKATYCKKVNEEDATLS
jgi:hypothetical protein